MKTFFLFAHSVKRYKCAGLDFVITVYLIFPSVVRRYDAFSSILGEGKPFVGIANSYLQSGHTVLLVLTLLCGFVELPGFPLTDLPYDVRDFLKVFFVLMLRTSVA